MSAPSGDENKRFSSTNTELLPVGGGPALKTANHDVVCDVTAAKNQPGEVRRHEITARVKPTRQQLFSGLLFSRSVFPSCFSVLPDRLNERAERRREPGGAADMNCIMRGPSIRETPFSTPPLTAEPQISELKCGVHADNAAPPSPPPPLYFTPSLYSSLEKRHLHNVVN